MNPASLVGALVAACLGLAPLQAAWALEFPIEYSGSYGVTYTTSNSFGSNLCSGQAALTITLLGDKTLSYVAAQLSIHVTSPPNAPPTCQISPTGKTVTLPGTHDLAGRFTVKFGDTPDTTMTGQYDDSSIRATYQPIPSWTSTFELPAVSHRIAIEPDPGRGFDFHKSILERQGFKIVIRDPHGRDHLDFGTLKILVGGSHTQPGTDTTAHALGRLAQGIVPFRDESPDSRTRVIHRLPDPTRLMQGHDIFAIPFNGDWRIELRICDLAQTCFNAVYTVYFGPFVSSPGALPVVDLRCSSPTDPFVQVGSAFAGNIGVDSPHTAVFFGLANPGLTDLWTYYVDDFGNGFAQAAWWQGQVRPLMTLLNMPSGYLYRQDPLRLPDWIAVPAGSGPPSLRRTAFPGGEYKLIMAALDMDTGTYRMDSHTVTMCDR
ncbi:MAG: hypothetical protein HY855_22995 [Burkholderiales bacterium]|nr:hypothetical protein [Burkholderiales bacterium]